MVDGENTLDADALRAQVGGLLSDQVRLAQGVGGLVSEEMAAAIEHLASAYVQFDQSRDIDD